MNEVTDNYIILAESKLKPLAEGLVVFLYHACY